MINRIFLLGRLSGPPIVRSLAHQDRAVAGSSNEPADRVSAVLPLTTFAPRLTLAGVLDHDRQPLEVHLTGRVAELAALVLEPGQLLWIDGRLESQPTVPEATSSVGSDRGSAPRSAGLRIIATWFTILASSEASRSFAALAGGIEGRSQEPSLGMASAGREGGWIPQGLPSDGRVGGAR